MFIANLLVPAEIVDKRPYFAIDTLLPSFAFVQLRHLHIVLSFLARFQLPLDLCLCFSICRARLALALAFGRFILRRLINFVAL